MAAETPTRTLIAPTEMNRRVGRFLHRFVLTATLIGFTLAFVFPLYWMASGALKSSSELAAPTPTLVPESFHPESYTDAWTHVGLGHFFLNTFVLALGAWLTQLLIDVSAAYALSKLRPVLGNVILGMMLATLMLPVSALLVPTYLTVVDVPILHVNLINTPFAVWLPAAANAFNIFLLKRFFDQIPAELLDSARIDGAARSGSWSPWCCCSPGRSSPSSRSSRSSASGRTSSGRCSSSPTRRSSPSRSRSTGWRSSCPPTSCSPAWSWPASPCWCSS